MDNENNELYMTIEDSTTLFEVKEFGYILLNSLLKESLEFLKEHGKSELHKNKISLRKDVNKFIAEFALSVMKNDYSMATNSIIRISLTIRFFMDKYDENKITTSGKQLNEGQYLEMCEFVKWASELIPDLKNCMLNMLCINSVEKVLDIKKERYFCPVFQTFKKNNETIFDKSMSERINEFETLSDEL